MSSAKPTPTPRRRASPALIAAKTLVHLLALTPAAILAWQIRAEYLTGSGGLGADPVAEIEHRLGLWALRLLLLTLAITPLRQLSGQPVLLRFRRMLGLYAFAYASLHLAAYLVLDLRGYWTQIFEEIAKRPYITVGFAAWLLLVPLALTSTQGMMRRLGRLWGRLHRLIYAIAVLAVLHFWWLVKSDVREPALYAAILAALLGWRLWKRLRALSARRTAAAG
ncbi:protein-methionine-sulfoxide reductase heme-binding subunit MsrQ [Lysobacter silvisoli]|uniref:Protein-methionine-sulfoxide reductase heme-binding subunit MsrQ n=1 Tax=Lysobacter silvisoli TaxID=2293254 RepID=A0A371K343_9GAMM|nr:protein-methionine-sulfoxide reductase heme-binding subunit MsrQ [Lysobacter silvisoli]RDZ28349.1 protein-methionine-sulfoxide reductase heme-binding subunit MsrQ [Lysobacter silvisoli]